MEFTINTKDKQPRQWVLFATGIIIKMLIIVLAILGILQTMSYEGFMGGYSSLLYFTIQSNITIAIVALMFAVINCIEFFYNKKIINNALRKIKFSFTVAITITCLVFQFMLAPQMEAASVFTFSNLALHAFVPILALADFFLFDYKMKTKKIDCLLSTPMPLYYLIFALIISTSGIKFYNGSNVPYFFLDYIKYGWFTISEAGLGVAYWIVILLFAFIGLGALLLLLKNLVAKHVAKQRAKKSTASVSVTDGID